MGTNVTPNIKIKKKRKMRGPLPSLKDIIVLFDLLAN